MKKLIIIILLSAAIGLPFIQTVSLAQNNISCEEDYIIQSGDSLSIIAQDRYGDPLAFPAIMAATNAQAEFDDSYATIDDPAVIDLGDKLCLPSFDDAQVLLGISPASPTPQRIMALEEVRYQAYAAIAFPTPTPTPTPTPAPTATATPPPPPAPAQAVPLPAGGPANQAFDYGIQVDPDGNPGFNSGHIQAIGFRWVKLQMPWKEVEPNPGNMQWGHWDQRIDAYHAAGLKVLLSIPKAPDWARPADDDKSVEGPPTNPQTYANFVGQVAARYAGRVQAIEVWNEQNLFYEAGGLNRVNVDTYMALLKAAYAAIKAANPGMIVVSGAPTPTGAPPPHAVDDVLYLRQMYERGLKFVSDAIGAHPSGFANPPDVLYTGGDFDPYRGYDDHRSFFFRNTMEEYRRVMVEFGDSNKTIWPTEFGWPVWRFQGDERFVFARDNSLEKQAQYIRRAYELGKAWGWVGVMFLWNLDYAVTAPNTELANFSILTQNGPTPAYGALQALPK